MFTNNFRKMMQALFAGASVSGFYNLAGEQKTIKGDGSYFGENLRMPGHYLKNAKLYDGSSGLFFGTDPTPATMDDYKLGAPISSGISIVNPSAFARTENADNDTATYTAAYTVTNTGSSEVNIYEVGIVSPSCLGSSGTTYYFLMEHTVLEEPITIAPSETKVITYKLTFRNAYIPE